MNGRHWTPLGVASVSVSDWFALDAILLGCEEEADKVGLGKHVFGRRRGVVGLLSNEELDVFETEGVLGGVGTASAVFAWAEEKEEGYPGEIADGDIYWCGSLGGGVQELDNADREGTYSCWERILFLVRRHLASHAKI